MLQVALFLTSFPNGLFNICITTPLDRHCACLGTVGEAEFKSAASGAEPASYVLEWSSVSYSPVTAFRVETRQAGTTAWRELSVSPVADGPFHYVGKLLLKPLAEATRYEARVSGRNDEGWNQPSQLFHFATRGAGL